mmetsp:Transcript_88404/g.247297  ORF Transcript_88404/g.247297 Transcript_88404/m.247297 type:complete len:210 (-) Transcript_88404:17-646(-)
MRDVQFGNAPSPMEQCEIPVNGNDLAEVRAQEAQEVHHVVELVHFAEDALPVRSPWRGGPTILRGAARARWVCGLRDRVGLSWKDNVADARVLVHREGADPVGLVELALPEELALQGSQLLPAQPRQNLLVGRRVQGVRHHGRHQVREAVRPRVRHEVVRHGVAPSHQHRGQGAVLVDLISRLGDDRLTHDVRGGVLGSVVVGHKVRRT